MKKSELIDLLFETFNQEKDIIKKNLLMCMDNVWLEMKDENIKIKLAVDVTRNR